MSLKTLAARIQYLGGDQLSRINKQKLESFRQALKNDYNSRMIKTDLHAAWPCLINSNNIKSDYDKKYISVEFDSGLTAGDTFECLDDGSHWMIYLPLITETAYLRSEIIKCRYTLEVNGKKYWIYFQGPTETDLRWFQKNQINVNELNLSGTIYIKNDENTKQFFKRFTRVKLDGHTWEVQVTDSITVPGIIELEVQEYYDNTIEELPEILKNPNIEVDPQPIFYGENIVKPDSVVGYMINPEYYNEKFGWSVIDNPRVKIEEVLNDGKICKVRIHAGTVKPFTLKYGDYTFPVTVDWKKSYISGPIEVYPYDICTYTIKDIGYFSIESERDCAKIIEQTGNQCKIEITSGKKDVFSLVCELESGEKYTLEVKIKSL